MITDSNVFIERAERFLNIAYNASEKFVAQRSREETNANALIAIALELQAIRKTLEKTDARIQARGR